MTDGSTEVASAVATEGAAFSLADITEVFALPSATIKSLTVPSPQWVSSGRFFFAGAAQTSGRSSAGNAPPSGGCRFSSSRGSGRPVSLQHRPATALESFGCSSTADWLVQGWPSDGVASTDKVQCAGDCSVGNMSLQVTAGIDCTGLDSLGLPEPVISDVPASSDVRVAGTCAANSEDKMI